MEFYAHSAHDPDRSDWEPLPVHHALVAHWARLLGVQAGIAKPAELAGRLHDLGKYAPDFQRRLAGVNIRVDHSSAGAVLILQEAERHARESGDGEALVVGQLIAHAIAGHHAGLPDTLSSDAASLRERCRGFDLGRLDPGWRSVLPLDLAGLMPPLRWSEVQSFRPFQLAMLGRMIFSCLVDADFKATERFYESAGERRKDRDWPSLGECLPAFLAGFDRRMAEFGPPTSDLGRLRAEILKTVRERAELAPGLFTLNVPTGGGKTLASLGFALDHARHHGHRRIIAAIPFTSIVDQTAAEWARVLGADHVLEHHSAIEEDEERSRDAAEADSARSAKNKMRLAMEDWAAPVVVTTHVQLFESLFAARTSRARKLHNIGRSVIILDEAQVLPLGLLGPTVQAIEELARNYDCSIVLCTATQPAFDARHYAKAKTPSPLALPLEGRELAPDPERLHRALRRTTVRHAGTLADEELVEALAGEDQALVIVNSRGHALKLYELAKAASLSGLVHLTTRQYAAHRRGILKDVRHSLDHGRPCRLIATSLIEAGVDVDFPVAWRAEAGLDQIVQAAGRVNREGKRPVEASIVTIFKPAEAKPPREIEGLIGDMAAILRRHAEDPFSTTAMTDYFREVYWRTGPAVDEKGILDKLTGLSHRGVDIAYRRIAAEYKMIEERMVPVIVPRDKAAIKAIKKLSMEKISSGAIARELQPYLVQTPPKARHLLFAKGHVAFVQPRPRGDQFAVLQYDDLYDEAVGLLWDDPDYLRVESMII